MAVVGSMLRVRWSTGEESSFVPSMGSITIVGRVRARPAPRGQGRQGTEAKPVKKLPAPRAASQILTREASREGAEGGRPDNWRETSREGAEGPRRQAGSEDEESRPGRQESAQGDNCQSEVKAQQAGLAVA